MSQSCLLTAELDLPLTQLRPDAAGWARTAQQLHDEGARLLSLWGEPAEQGGSVVCALWLREQGLLLARLDVGAGGRYPGLHAWFPVAQRLQRGLRDLLGPFAQGMDPRPWLRHQAWSSDWHPLRPDAGEPRRGEHAEPYEYVEVQGQGVHEINVGPVHAGIIEPGQFRFSLLGEQVLRLEQRLGWTHKGVARLFQRRDAAAAVRLAARLSGDSTVAGAWACCMALEAAAGLQAPPRARQLRALLLERERIANHLGDIGAIAGDTGLAFGQSQFSMLKEQVLRMNQQAFGVRWPMDALCPGGVARDIAPSSLGALDAQCLRLADDARVLLAAFDQHAGLQDRLRATGRVEPGLARELGMLGLAARASGQDLDLRRHMPLYAGHGLRVPLQAAGDVASRMAQRFDELFESLRLCRELLLSLPGGALCAPWPGQAAGFARGWSLGLVEGWRGPVLVALRLDGDGRVAQAHAHDASWQNWPAVELAATRDIIADFPLINKSFNLSYSGHDN